MYYLDEFGKCNKIRCLSLGIQKTYGTENYIKMVAKRLISLRYRDRGTYQIRAYLSFIQHKNPEIICSPDGTFS